MDAASFDSTILRFLRQEPFHPFVVELNDGRLIEIVHPRLAMGGGGAAFISPEDELVEFNCEEVRAIRPLVPGAAS
jgi:hypothetical protein